MSNADRYRDHACHCVIKVEQAQRTEAKLSWLYMAQTWLGMIPEPKRTVVDALQVAVWDQETLRKPATSQP